MRVKDRMASFAARGRLRASVIGLAVAVVVALALLQGVNLWSRHRQTVSETEVRTSDLTYILAEHMRSSISAVDASLKQLVLHSARVGGPNAPAASWQPVLGTAIAGMSYVGSLTVTDADGVIRHSTIPALIGQSRREEYLFTRLAADPKAGIVADTPFRSLIDQRIIIPLGRALVAADGSFQGVVVATLVPEAFRDFYKSVDVGHGGLIWVMHSTGLVFFREPSTADPRQTIDLSPLLRAAMQQSNAGVLRAPLDPGGPTYVSAWHALDEPPIIIAVSFNMPEALRAWRRDALLSIGLTLLVALAMGVASFQVVRQVDARAAAEQTLVQRDQELVEAQRVAGLGAARFTGPSFMVQVSSQLCTLLVLPAESGEMTLDTLLERLIVPDRARLREALESCLASGRRCELEVHAKNPEGAERILQFEGVVQDTGDSEGASIFAIFQDVTEHRLAEQRSTEAQRLAALGRLTGGVAHDFNNLLTVIKGYSDLLLARLDENDPARRSIEEIEKAAERAAGRTRQLLAFSRKQILQPKVLELNTIVADVENMLRRLIGEDIQLAFNLDPALGRVKADPGQLEQVLLNLAVNARDAMPQGGRLIIETTNVNLDEIYARNYVGVEPGPYVMLAVSDTGCGMDKETQSQIFEPFFTTKEAGKGTGLGLSTAYGIVKQSGGNIWVYSEPGKGTTFKIYLPRVGEPSEIAETRAPATGSFRGSETILLVEDEETLRKLAREILETSGYTVLAAANANEALFLHSQHQGQIGLMVTDVVMPEMSGRELAQHIATLDSEMKVLFMSGYTDDAIVFHGVLEEGIDFLQKPFSLEALERKVREVLDKRQE
jgi:signal transduction histidine kinase/ActR/RegA family two-component response regulator